MLLPRLSGRWLWAVFLLPAAALLNGCSTLGPAAFTTWQIEGSADASTVLFHGIPIRTGQIVASEQGSPQSIFLSLLIADHYEFVHTGVIAIEDGYPVIYEANGQIRPSLGGGPPTRNVGGGVRRVTLESFLNKQRFIAIYDPPAGADRERIGQFARDSLANRVAFDSYFDREDPSKVYCSEFTALALAAGGVGPRRSSRINPNESVAIVLDWLEITTPDIIPAGAIIADANRVALFSRLHNRAQIEAYFDVKAELHRRFTPDQNLGNVLHFSTLGGFKFQPEIKAFMRTVNAAAGAWGDLPPAEVEQRVRALAIEQLGPFDREQVVLRLPDVPPAKD